MGSRVLPILVLTSIYLFFSVKKLGKMAIKQLIALCLLLGHTCAESKPEPEAEPDADPYFGFYGGHHPYHYNHYRPRPYYHHPPVHHRPYHYRPVYKKPAYIPYKPKKYSYKPLGPVLKKAPAFAPAPAPAPVQPAAPPPSPAPIIRQQPVQQVIQPLFDLKAFPAVPDSPAPSVAAAPRAEVPVDSFESYQPQLEPQPKPYNPTDFEPQRVAKFVDDIEVIGAPQAVDAVPEAVASDAIAPGVVASQYHAQDEFGNVAYGYSNGQSQKQEQRDAYGNVYGTYSYDDGTGVPKHVSYIADDFGFRITAANNLPRAGV